jgi:hypothetical protein
MLVMPALPSRQHTPEALKESRFFLENSSRPSSRLQSKRHARPRALRTCRELVVPRVYGR